MQTLNNSAHFTVLWTQCQAPRENVATIFLGEDCGMCKFCLDKLKYWGTGKKKQCCIKQCYHAMKADMVSLSSRKRTETSKGKKQAAVS